MSENSTVSPMTGSDDARPLRENGTVDQEADGARSERRVDRAVFVVRRVGLLVLVVGCLIVPVVSIAANALGSREQGSAQTYCADPSTPCELPQVIPTGRVATAYHADAASESIFGRIAHLTPLTWSFIAIAVLCVALAVTRARRSRRA